MSFKTLGHGPRGLGGLLPLSLLLSLLILALSALSGVSGKPVTEDEVRINIDEHVNEWNAFWERVKNTLYGKEGEKVRFTDILILVAAAIIIIVFATCIIGYLFCECVKKILCCCC